MTLTGTTTTMRKRKAAASIEDDKKKAAKQPKRTLESFFSPQVLAAGVPTDEKATREHVALNAEQIRVLKMVVEEEKNVFFTGSAGELPNHPYGSLIHITPLGTGKSLLLRAIINALRKKHAKKPEMVSITASTGMAALNIGGAFAVCAIRFSN